MNTLTILLVIASMPLVGCDISADPEARYTLDDVTVKAGDTEGWTFDKDTTGSPPAGANVFSGKWTVRSETSAPSSPNALCQTADEDYPALRLGNQIYGNATLVTRFMPISGETDQAAGIIFRVQDSENYYIVRANALEGNVAFYLYGDGGREQMGEDGIVDIPSGTWQELKVVVRGNRFTVFVNGSEILSHEDDSFVAGGVGGWTKADSQTCLDDFVAVAE